MIAGTEGTKRRFSPVRLSSRISLRFDLLKCFFLLFTKIKHVFASIQAGGWPFLRFVIQYLYLLNKYIKCNAKRLAARYDHYMDL